MQASVKTKDGHSPKCCGISCALAEDVCARYLPATLEPATREKRSPIKNPHEESRRTAADAAVRAQQVDVVTRAPSNTARAWRLLREAGQPAAKDIFVP